MFLRDLAPDYTSFRACGGLRGHNLCHNLDELCIVTAHAVEGTFRHEALCGVFLSDMKLNVVCSYQT